MGTMLTSSDDGTLLLSQTKVDGASAAITPIARSSHHGFGIFAMDVIASPLRAVTGDKVSRAGDPSLHAG
jgi:hypothetical protein